VTTFRLADYFVAVQCVAATAAFAGNFVPEPATMTLFGGRRRRHRRNPRFTEAEVTAAFAQAVGISYTGPAGWLPSV